MDQKCNLESEIINLEWPRKIRHFLQICILSLTSKNQNFKLQKIHEYKRNLRGKPSTAILILNTFKNGLYYKKNKQKLIKNHFIDIWPGYDTFIWHWLHFIKCVNPCFLYLKPNT